MAGSLRRLAFWSILLVAGAAAVALLATEAEATHLRGGTMYATTPDPVNDPYMARIHAVFYLRASSAGSPPAAVIGAPTPICFGDGACSWSYVARQTMYDPVQDVAGYEAFDAASGQAGIPHRYAGPGPWTYSSSTCCMMSRGPTSFPSTLSEVHHYNNPDAVFQLQGKATLPTNQPYVAQPRATTYCPTAGCSIGLAPSNGVPATVRMATGAETGNWQWEQPGPCTNPNACGAPSTTAWVTNNPPAWNWIPGPGAATAPAPHLPYYSTSVQLEGANGDRSPILWLVLLNKPTGDLSPNPPPAVPPPEPAHTHDIAFVQAANGHLRWTVTAADAAEAAAEGVVVEAKVCQQGGSCITRTGTTDAAGQTRFNWPGNPPTGTYTLCVTGMSGTGWEWDEDAGHAADGNCRTDTV